MKQLTVLMFLLVFIFLGCDTSNSPQEATLAVRSSLAENLEIYFERLSSLKKFNGGVLVQQNGKRILYEVYNMDEDPASSLEVNKKSQFDIHSISKLMAQAAIVKLEENQLISRSDYLNQHLPDFPHGAIITIEDLIENRSGLPRGFSKTYPNLIDKSPAELVELIKKEPLLFKPGSETLYSNLGYELLYFIIAQITKKPFVQYLEEAFFQPLQMKNTGAHFHLSKNNLRQLVKNHELDHEELAVVPNIQKEGKNQAKIYSTIEDLLKFIDHVKQEPYRSILKNKSEEIAWSGGGDGILSHAKASLKSDYELVFFSNYDEIPFGKILETVERIMTNQSFNLPEPINRKSVPIETSILEKYVGQYKVKEFNNDIFEYRLEDGKLVFYQHGQRNSVLNAANDSSFFDQPDAEDYFEFRKVNPTEYKLIFHYKQLEIEGKKIK